MQNSDRKFWSNFVYARVLDGFCKSLENRARREKQPVLKRPGRIRVQRLRVIRAMKGVTGAFVRFIQAEDATLSDLIQKTKAPAESFMTYENEVIERLSSLVPDVNADERHIWPGPLSVQQTIALFVRTCVRAHCERPDLEAKKIVIQVGHSVIAPALAYLAYLSSQGPNAKYTHDALEEMAKGKSEPRTAYKSTEQRRWFLLLATLADVASCEEGDLSLSAKELADFFEEVMQLMQEHARDPHGGRLWQSLGMLSSTSPASADTLLFQVLRKLDNNQEAEARTPAIRSRIVCASIRYEVIRNAVYNETLRTEVMGPQARVLALAEKALEGKPDDRHASIEQLQFAFLVSRRALLPSRYRKGDDIRQEIEFAKLAHRLLRHNCDSPHEDIQRIAQRYRTGLVSNPRFARDATLLSELDGCINDYKIITGGKPTLLSHLFNGRRAWLRLLAGIGNTKVSEVQKFYAEAAGMLFSAQGNYGGETVGAGNSASSIDSEAPVWLLPELATLLRLGPDLDKREHYAHSFGEPDRSNKDKKRDGVAASVLRIGERQFGVYLNHRSEDLRIKQGILLGAEALRR